MSKAKSIAVSDIENFVQAYLRVKQGLQESYRSFVEKAIRSLRKNATVNPTFYVDGRADRQLPEWRPTIVDGAVTGFILNESFAHWMAVTLEYLKNDAPDVYHTIIPVNGAGPHGPSKVEAQLDRIDEKLDKVLEPSNPKASDGGV